MLVFLKLFIFPMVLVFYFQKGSNLKLWSSNPYFTRNTSAILLWFLLKSYIVTKDTSGNFGLFFFCSASCPGSCWRTHTEGGRNIKAFRSSAWPSPACCLPGSNIKEIKLNQPLLSYPFGYTLLSTRQPLCAPSSLWNSLLGGLKMAISWMQITWGEQPVPPKREMSDSVPWRGATLFGCLLGTQGYSEPSVSGCEVQVLFAVCVIMCQKISQLQEANSCLLKTVTR